MEELEDEDSDWTGNRPHYILYTGVKLWWVHPIWMFLIFNILFYHLVPLKFSQYHYIVIVLAYYEHILDIALLSSCTPRTSNLANDLCGLSLNELSFFTLAKITLYRPYSLLFPLFCRLTIRTSDSVVPCIFQLGKIYLPPLLTINQVLPSLMPLTTNSVN